MELLEQIKENAKKQSKTIVLPEGTEERTIQAADQIIGEGIANIILIGSPDEIKTLAEKYQLKNIGKANHLLRTILSILSVILAALFRGVISTADSIIRDIVS